MALDPDRYTVIKLIGTAARLYNERGDRGAAVEQLRAIAGGRADLLAQAAGHHLGADAWNSAVCHQLLVDAGADVDLIEAAAAVVRHNLETTAHTSAGTRAPGR